MLTSNKVFDASFNFKTNIFGVNLLSPPRCISKNTEKSERHSVDGLMGLNKLALLAFVGHFMRNLCLPEW
jgi:hypothetical protein